jgi:hypothetical protein
MSAYDDLIAGDFQRVRDEAKMDYDPEPTLQDEEREDMKRFYARERKPPENVAATRRGWRHG